MYRSLWDVLLHDVIKHFLEFLPCAICVICLEIQLKLVFFLWYVVMSFFTEFMSAQLNRYTFLGFVLFLLTFARYVVHTASWSLIPGITSTLWHRSDDVTSINSEMFPSLVGSWIICVRPRDSLISTNCVFTRGLYYIARCVLDCDTVTPHNSREIEIPSNDEFSHSVSVLYTQ